MSFSRISGPRSQIGVVSVFSMIHLATRSPNRQLFHALYSSLSFEGVEEDDDWLTCSSLIGDSGSFAYSGVVALDASMLS